MSVCPFFSFFTMDSKFLSHLKHAKIGVKFENGQNRFENNFFSMSYSRRSNFQTDTIEWKLGSHLEFVKLVTNFEYDRNPSRIKIVIEALSGCESLC